MLRLTIKIFTYFKDELIRIKAKLSTTPPAPNTSKVECKSCGAWL